MTRKMPEQRDRDAKKRKNKEKRRKFAQKSFFRGMIHTPIWQEKCPNNAIAMRKMRNFKEKSKKVCPEKFFSRDDSYSYMTRKMPEQRGRDAKKRKNKEKRRKFAGKSVFLTPNDSSEGGKPPIKILNVGEKLCCTKKEIRRRLKSAIRFHSFFRSSPQFSFSSVRAVSRRETFSWFFSLGPPSSDSLSVGWSTETSSPASEKASVIGVGNTTRFYSARTKSRCHRLVKKAGNKNKPKEMHDEHQTGTVR